MNVRAFIQARMSSERFPGKVLAPLAGRPLIAHVVDRVAAVVPANRIVIATSTAASDDPLACYVESLGVAVSRGPLGNVFERFRLAISQHPCDWFFRVCGDSPLLDTSLFAVAVEHAERRHPDLVTNVYPRTFPPGQSVELVRTNTFMRIDDGRLSAGDREHVTSFYYEHPSDFIIINFENPEPVDPSVRFTVDTPTDLLRIGGAIQGLAATIAIARGEQVR